MVGAITGNAFGIAGRRAAGVPGKAAGITAVPTLVKGLISYWKFDEGAGTTVNDSIGTNTGTWGGTLGSQWGAGKVRSGGNPAGQAYVTFGQTTTSAMVGNGTISTWARSISGISGTQLIFGNWTSNSSGNWGLFYCDTNTSPGGVEFLSGGNAANSAKVFNDGAWHHYVGVRSGSNISLYVDAVLIASTGAASISNAGAAWAVSCSNFPFNGGVDECGIWARDLSAAEVVLMYNNSQYVQPI